MLRYKCSHYIMVVLIISCSTITSNDSILVRINNSRITSNDFALWLPPAYRDKSTWGNPDIANIVNTSFRKLVEHIILLDATNKANILLSDDEVDNEITKDRLECNLTIDEYIDHIESIFGVPYEIYCKRIGELLLIKKFLMRDHRLLDIVNKMNMPVANKEEHNKIKSRMNEIYGCVYAEMLQEAINKSSINPADILNIHGGPAGYMYDSKK
jgi:hypothetical protein